MTPQEAIKAIRSNWPDSRYTILRDALEMAEEALRDRLSRPCYYCDDNFEFWQSELGYPFGVDVKVKYCPMCGRKLEVK